MKHAFAPRRPVVPLALFLMVTGCAAQTATRYPSLLPRAIETRGESEPEAVTTVATADPVADSELAKLRASLDEALAAFAPAAAAADRLTEAAKGDPVGGERWIAAQTALGDLDGQRAATSSILSDIDALALARAADGKPDYPAIATLHDDAQAALDAQTARIATIGARLPSA